MTSSCKWELLSRIMYEMGTSTTRSSRHLGGSWNCLFVMEKCSSAAIVFAYPLLWKAFKWYFPHSTAEMFLCMHSEYCCRYCHTFRLIIYPYDFSFSIATNMHSVYCTHARKINEQESSCKYILALPNAMSHGLWNASMPCKFSSGTSCTFVKCEAFS